MRSLQSHESGDNYDQGRITVGPAAFCIIKLQFSGVYREPVFV